MNLDYSALNQPLTENDLKTYYRWRRSPGLKSSAYIKEFGLLTFAALISANVVFFLLSDLYETTLLFVIIANITMILIALAILTTHLIYEPRGDKFQARLLKFAKANGITLSFWLTENLPGVMFDRERNGHSDGSLIFKNGTIIGNYEYSMGVGKSISYRRGGYARILLKNKLPHIVLDAKSNNGFLGQLSNLPADFRDQKILLEGDFNKYFTLYAPKKYEREALYVFTPDVMAAILDAGTNYDAEIVDDSLMLYSKEGFQLDSEHTLRGIMKIVDTIGGQIYDQTKRYSGTHHGQQAANTITRQGYRLKTKVNPVIILLCIVVSILVSLFYFSVIDSFLG